MVVPASIALGMMFAILVNNSTWLGTLLRTAFFYPIVLPLVSVASIWLFIMTPEYGLLGKLADLLGMSEGTVVAPSRGVCRCPIKMPSEIRDIDVDMDADSHARGSGTRPSCRSTGCPQCVPIGDRS